MGLSRWNDRRGSLSWGNPSPSPPEPGMNEDEWFNEIDFTRHVRFVEPQLSTRKSRLLAAAFCRTVLQLHSESYLQRAVKTAEEFADGNCTLQELESCRQQCRESAIRAHEEWVRFAEVNSSEAMKWWLLDELAWAVSYVATTPVSVEAVSQKVAGIAIQARTGDSGVIRLQSSRTTPELNHLTDAQNREFRALVWDVVGNPYAPVRLRDEWRTSTALALARGMYQSRDFAAMPILADALQDVGCNEDRVLDHCRGTGNHVRGCWCLDLLLGKS